MFSNWVRTQSGLCCGAKLLTGFLGCSGSLLSLPGYLRPEVLLNSWTGLLGWLSAQVKLLDDLCNCPGFLAWFLGWTRLETLSSLLRLQICFPTWVGLWKRLHSQFSLPADDANQGELPKEYSVKQSHKLCFVDGQSHG